jgi:hypothetical protein
MSQFDFRSGRATARLATLATSVLALSAAAAGVMLSSGEAKASAWVVNPSGTFAETTSYDSSDGTGVNGFDFDWSPVLGDKRIKLNSVTGMPLGDAMDHNSFQFDLTSNLTRPWHVDLDMAGNGSSGPGSLNYDIKVVTPTQSPCPNAPGFGGFCGPLFDTVHFNAPTNASATKTIRDTLNGTILATLTPGQMVTLPGSYSSLNVNIDWVGTTSDPIDGVGDEYSQVPAPLPILGAAAAFGSMRKMRKFSSHLKAFTTV